MLAPAACAARSVDSRVHQLDRRTLPPGVPAYGGAGSRRLIMSGKHPVVPRTNESHLILDDWNAPNSNRKHTLAVDTMCGAVAVMSFEVASLYWDCSPENMADAMQIKDASGNQMHIYGKLNSVEIYCQRKKLTIDVVVCSLSIGVDLLLGQPLLAFMRAKPDPARGTCLLYTVLRTVQSRSGEVSARGWHRHATMAWARSRRSYRQLRRTRIRCSRTCKGCCNLMRNWSNEKMLTCGWKRHAKWRCNIAPSVKK